MTVAETLDQVARKSFVFVEPMAKALAMALMAKQNILLYGPPGHGKSEFVRAGLRALGLWDNTFVKALGSGTSMHDLYGGLDMKALNETGEMRYLVSFSFLHQRVALFEEIFDAPASALTSLKDTLSDRRFNNGCQNEPMETEVVIGLTNKSPAELTELGPSEAALVERFPIQKEVLWPSYCTSRYRALFHKIFDERLSDAEERLCNILEMVAEEGMPVSPRSARRIVEIMRSHARLYSREETEMEDLQEALEYSDVPLAFTSELGERLDRERYRERVRDTLNGLENEHRDLVEQLAEASTPIPLLQIRKKLERLHETLGNVSVPDDLADQHMKISTRIETSQLEAVEKAIRVTRILD